MSQDAPALPAAADVEEPAVTAAPAVERDPKDEADRFARITFRPSRGGRVKLAEIPAAYRDWCHGRGLDPLPDLEIGAALSALFSSVGLYRRGAGASAVIVGMDWSARGPALLARPGAAEWMVRCRNLVP